MNNIIRLIIIIIIIAFIIFVMYFILNYDDIYDMVINYTSVINIKTLINNPYITKKYIIKQIYDSNIVIFEYGTMRVDLIENSLIYSTSIGTAKSISLDNIEIIIPLLKLSEVQ